MGALYIVGTPIGNLEDISERALATFRIVDLIACEDTRETKKILGHYGIATPCLSLHQHSNDAKLQRLVDEMVLGRKIAFASDAGTPGISDPGGRLVELAAKKEIRVIPIAGPSAVTAILSVCGFSSDQFQFLGFFPRKKGRQTMLRALPSFELTTVFFESPHRIHKTMSEIGLALGDTRHIVVGRELTKQFEEIIRGTAQEVADAILAKEPRGEYVFVIEPK